MIERVERLFSGCVEVVSYLPEKRMEKEERARAPSNSPISRW